MSFDCYVSAPLLNTSMCFEWDLEEEEDEGTGIAVESSPSPYNSNGDATSGDVHMKDAPNTTDDELRSCDSLLHMLQSSKSTLNYMQ